MKSECKDIRTRNADKGRDESEKGKDADQKTIET